MPSLLESVTALLGEGDTLSKLGELMGGDSEQASAATKLAVPAVLGGVADTAAQESGLDAVMGMLDDNGSVLDDLGGFLGAGQAEAGNGVLDAVFGDGRADMVSSLASQADIGSSMMGKLLPMLAPLVMGVIGKRRADDGMDAAAVATLLADEREGLEKEGLFDGASAKMAGAAAAVAGAGAVMGSGATGKLDDAAGTTGDAAGAVGDKATDAAAAATGAAGKTADAAKEAASAGKDKAKGAAAAAAGAGGKLGDKVTGAGVKGPDDGSSDGGTGSLGWLWWALGAVVLVLLLAWILSTCNDDSIEVSEENPSSESTESDIADDSDSDDGDSDDADSDGSDDADSDGTDSADAGADADLQAEVDAALEGTGVTGSVAAGVVTLTGSVETDDLSAEAEEAIAALSGVSSVDNEIVVGEADAGADDGSGDESDGDDEADDDGEVDASAGDTINELLDLDPVTFRVSSARITDQGKLVLDDAAAFLEANPNVEIEIGGHTDDDGEEAENLQLSQLRAESVRDYLTQQGIDADRMETQGYGESEPKVPNTSSSAKAENRRIEFTIQ